MQMDFSFGVVRASYAAAVLLMLTASSGQAQRYVQKNLVSNVGGDAKFTDSDLVNSWGLSRASGSAWWVADNGTGKATLYDGMGNKQGLIVSGLGQPTGTVFNGTGSFNLPGGAPSIFLFASLDGTIRAWTPGTTEGAVVVKNPSASYTGLAIASAYGKYYLYAVDFHNGHIDVFDTNFERVKAFDHDFHIDNIVQVPFNVQNIGGTLFVTFAKQDPSKQFQVFGPGEGLVAAFASTGKLQKIFQCGSWLDAPWGVALAPGDFGTFSHDLLVGQLGSGNIVAYDLITGKFLGEMQDSQGNTLAIPGLWDLSFGFDPGAGLPTTLFFAAGPSRYADGLFGKLRPDPADQVLGNGQ